MGIDSSGKELREISKSSVIAEKKERKPKMDNLTSIEWELLGEPESLVVNGKEIFIDGPSLRYLLQDPDKRKAALSPLNVARGDATLEEALKARKQMKELSSMISVFFDFEHWGRYQDQDIRLAFDPEKPDEAGEFTKFKFYPVQNGQKIDISRIAPEDRVVRKDLSYVFSFVEEKDNALEYRIKSIGEIKREAVLMPAKM